MEAKGFSFFGADKESLEVRPAAQRLGGWGIPDLGQGRWDHPPNPRFILKWVKLGMVEEAIPAKLEKEKKGMNPNIFPIYGDGGSLQKIAMVEGCGSPKGGRSGVVGSLGVQGRRQLVGAERHHSATVHRSKLGIAASQPPFRPTYFPAKGPRTSSESFALHRPPAKVIVGSSLGNFGCLEELVNFDEVFSLTPNFWLSRRQSKIL